VVGIYFEWNGMMSFVTFAFFHILVSYMIEFWASKTFGDFILFYFGANKDILLYVAHCIISPIPFAKIHLYLGYFNM
jgi:hypothetical protein